MEHNFTWKNDGRTKICIGLGTRPEIIRLAAVIRRCREYFDTCVIYYNQNWDKNLSTVFWEDFELKNSNGEFGPDILVPVVGENLGVTCGNILGRSYELLSAHREENIDTEKNFLSLFTAINALAEKYDMPILYSCHPRSKNRLEKSGFKLDSRVRVNEPLGFNDYNCLQMNALAIVSDSGTLPEESSFYLSSGHPIAAVCIRTSTERPEALEAGDFILAGITTKELLNATDMAIKMKNEGVLGKPCPDYTDETVSMKVVRIIQGYVNVVNKFVWRKY